MATMKLTDLTTQQLSSIFINNSDLFNNIYKKWYKLTINNYKEQLKSIGFRDTSAAYSRGYIYQRDSSLLVDTPSIYLRKLNQSLIDSGVLFVQLQYVENPSYKHNIKYIFDCDENGNKMMFINAYEAFMLHIHNELKNEYYRMASLEHFLTDVADGIYDHLDVTYE